MAFISQEEKKAMMPAIKAVLNKYGQKGSVRIANHSKIICTVKSGKLDILGAQKQAALLSNRFDLYCPSDVDQLNWVLSRTCCEVNCYYVDENHYADSEVVKFLNELTAALKGPGYFDESDSQSDYFHCSHYVAIKIGQYDKPYVCSGKAKQFDPVELKVA